MLLFTAAILLCAVQNQGITLKVEIFKSEVESFLIIQKYPHACASCLTKYYVFFICKEEVVY